MKLDNNSLNLGGTSLVLRRSAVESTTKTKTVSDSYNEHAKLVFLFDVSGSMNSRIAVDKTGESYFDQYLWPENFYTDMKAKVDAYILALQNDDDDTVQAAGNETTFVDMNGQVLFTDETSLKSFVLKNNLMSEFNVLPNTLTQSKHQEPPTRIGIVRKLAKQEIHARFKKFPDSRIAVIPFSGTAAPLFDDGKQDELDAAIDKIDINLAVEHKNAAGEVVKLTYMDGSTDILNAIHEGMEVCRKNPSAVGIHHIIIVTDGGAGVYGISQWKESMKASGVVLDYIHIGDEMPNAELVAFCKELGGDCVTVNAEKDLKEKFQIATQRLMLPPAPSK